MLAVYKYENPENFSSFEEEAYYTKLGQGLHCNFTPYLTFCGLEYWLSFLYSQHKEPREVHMFVDMFLQEVCIKIEKFDHIYYMHVLLHGSWEQ